MHNTVYSVKITVSQTAPIQDWNTHNAVTAGSQPHPELVHVDTDWYVRDVVRSSAAYAALRPRNRR